jgi:Mg2+ and Co2+ transporter CorA
MASRSKVRYRTLFIRYSGKAIFPAILTKQADKQDHLITMTQNLNHYEKILSRSHSNYLAQISIEMTDANNQINDVLSKLTALGTVLMYVILLMTAANGY